MLTATIAASMVAGISMVVHLISFRIAGGQSLGFAAAVVRLFGLMSLLRRIMIRPLADRVARRLIPALPDWHTNFRAAGATPRRHSEAHCSVLPRAPASGLLHTVSAVSTSRPRLVRLRLGNIS